MKPSSLKQWQSHSKLFAMQIFAHNLTNRINSNKFVTFFSLSLYGLIFEFQIDEDERIQHWFMYVYGARWEFVGIWIKHELNNSQRNAWKWFELKGASVKRRRFFLFVLTFSLQGKRNWMAKVLKLLFIFIKFQFDYFHTKKEHAKLSDSDLTPNESWRLNSAWFNFWLHFWILW